MIKKGKLIFALCGVLIIGGIAIPSVFRNMQQSKTLEAIQDVAYEFEKTNLAIVTSLKELDWNMEETCQEKLFPIQLADKDENTLTFWNYTCINPELKGADSAPILYSEVFDPATAIIDHEVKINDVTGTIYQKDHRSYLLWSPLDADNKVLLLIDYDPQAVEEWEVIKMAESCR